MGWKPPQLKWFRLGQMSQIPAMCLDLRVILVNSGKEVTCVCGGGAQARVVCMCVCMSIVHGFVELCAGVYTYVLVWV